LTPEIAALTTGAAVVRPPIRLVHLGLGAFHRSHQLWHTAVADTENDWGYAAYTGRRPNAASDVAAQGCLYTVTVRTAEEDRTALIGSLVEAHDGTDIESLARHVSDPAVAVITLTITEAGYHLDATGGLDEEDPIIVGDRDALSGAADAEAVPPLKSAVGRLVFALERRRIAGAGPVTVLPCDNMPANGAVVRTVVHALASSVSSALVDWITSEVSFVSSVVDRITPATTPADVHELAARIGVVDQGMVVTEAFSEWVVSGDFPAGRPPWERSGVRFVPDIAPYERRKLWMLNGAHTLLATMARPLGHATVAEAVADPRVRRWLEDYWDSVQTVLVDPELDLTAYRRSLVERFANPRIAHHLDQIAAETTTKIRYRIVPVLVAEREAGRMPEACVRTVAAWVKAMREGRRDTDAQNARIDEVLAGPVDRVVPGLLSLLDGRLSADRALRERVEAADIHTLDTHALLQLAGERSATRKGSSR